MKEYVKNMKKYFKNMKEYEEICQYIEFGTPISIWALGRGKFHARTSSWALGLRKILTSAYIQAMGFEKMLIFPFLRLQPVGEGVTLLSPPYKLQTHPVNLQQ